MTTKILNIILYIIIVLGLVLVISYFYKSLGTTTNLLESFINNENDNSSQVNDNNLNNNNLNNNNEYINVNDLLENTETTKYIFSGYSEILDFILSKNIISFIKNKYSTVNLKPEQKKFVNSITFEDIPRIHIYVKNNEPNTSYLFFHPKYYKKSDALIKLNKNLVIKNKQQYPRIEVPDIEKTQRFEKILNAYNMFNDISITNEYTNLLSRYIKKNKSMLDLPRNTILNYDELSNYKMILSDVNKTEFSKESYLLSDLIYIVNIDTEPLELLKHNNNYNKVNESIMTNVYPFSNILFNKFRLITNNEDKQTMITKEKEYMDILALEFILKNQSINTNIDYDRVSNYTSSLIEPNTLNISFRLNQSTSPDDINYNQLVNMFKDSDLKHNKKKKTITAYVLKSDIQSFKLIWNY